MRFDILTLFPEIITNYCSQSILGRGQKAGHIKIVPINIRDYTLNKQKHVDGSPYGGGAGMVLMAEPILRAMSAVPRAKKSKVIVLSAKGKMFNQKTAYDWSKKYDQLILISGRYEGIDERVKTILKADEISIGPFVLTDGDVAAMTIVSAVARLIPGVIKLESLAEESFTKSQIPNPKSQINNKSKIQKSKKLVIGNWSLEIFKEYPHYTRPEVLEYKGKKYRVPKILLSGDHAKIKEWREKKAGGASKIKD